MLYKTRRLKNTRHTVHLYNQIYLSNFYVYKAKVLYLKVCPRLMWNLQISRRAIKSKHCYVFCLLSVYLTSNIQEGKFVFFLLPLDFFRRLYSSSGYGSRHIGPRIRPGQNAKPCNVADPDLSIQTILHSWGILACPPF